MTFAWNTMIKRIETMASPMTPFEKTSRSPRFWNCLGMNPSRARIDDSRGKSAKLVLGGDDQDGHGGHLQGVVEDRAVAVYLPAHLAHDRVFEHRATRRARGRAR